MRRTFWLLGMLGAGLCCVARPAAAAPVRLVGDYFIPANQSVAAPLKGALTRFRGKCPMWLFAEPGAAVVLHVTEHQVSPRYLDNLSVTVDSPSGKEVLRGEVKPGQTEEFAFRAEAGGAYAVQLDARSNASQITASGARLCTTAAMPGCHVIHGSQPLWFYVPANSTGFQIQLRGEGTAETATVLVFDPQGKQAVQGSTAGSDRALVEVAVPAGQGGKLWSLQIVRAKTGVFEDASFALQGNVGPYVAQRPGDVVVPVMRTQLAAVLRRGDPQPVELTGTVLIPPALLQAPALSVRVAEGRREVYAAAIPVNKGEFHVAIPAQKLVPGSYQAQVLLKDADKIVAQSQHPLFVVDRPRNLDVRRATRVGGKPLFARGLYHVDPKDYALVKRQGFNIVQAAPAQVSKCEAAGLKAAVMLYGGMRIRPDYYRQQIAAYKDHPAVACWMIMDEPDGNRTPLEEVQAAYGLIRALDPDRPAYMCLCQPNCYGSYGCATDIIAIDVYPVQAGTNDIGPIFQALDTARRDVPQQAVWFIGQVWSWPGHKDPARRRLVTAAEHRAMTYLSLVHDNVCGLMWYSFRDPQWYLPESNPQVWEACRKVNEELATLEPVLLAGNRSERVLPGCGGDVHIAVKEYQGSRYVIAVNPGYEATMGRIPAGNAAAAEVLFEGRSVPVAAGVLNDPFDALAVHVYKIGSSVTRP